MIDNTKMMMGKDEDVEEVGVEEEVGIDRMVVIDIGVGIEMVIEEEEIEVKEQGIDQIDQHIEIGNKEGKEMDIEGIGGIEVIEVKGVIEEIEEIEGIEEIEEVEEEEIKAKDVSIMISKQEDYLIIKRKFKHNCLLKNKVIFF